MIESQVHAAMASTDRHRAHGWNTDIVLANNIVINMLQGANGQDFFDIQHYRLNGWLRDTMAGTLMMSSLCPGAALLFPL